MILHRGHIVSMDECERAAEIYQCGKEKAPAVLAAIQSTLTVTTRGVEFLKDALGFEIKVVISRVLVSTLLCPMIRASAGPKTSPALLTYGRIP
jgi:hypothetical protein